MSERKMNEIASTRMRINVDTGGGDLQAWLTITALTYHLKWALLHCDEGAIWGALHTGGIAFSSESFHPRQLRPSWATLQRCRLFGLTSEILLWRGPQGWQARLRDDRSGAAVRYLDEEQMLWGNRAVGASRNGFWEVAEGIQGIVHAPPIRTEPINVPPNNAAPSLRDRTRLAVRHYIVPDLYGMLRIVESRLVALIESGA